MKLATRSPLDIEALFQRVRHDDDVAERAVLGALVSGALGLADVAELPDCAFWYPLNASIFAVLTSALEARAAGFAVPGRRGLDLAFAVQACAFVGVRGAGAVYRDVKNISKLIVMGYLARAARAAPQRWGALEAVRVLRALASKREADDRDRDRAIAAFVRTMKEAAANLTAETSALGPVLKMAVAMWEKAIDAAAAAEVERVEIAIAREPALEVLADAFEKGRAA